MSTILYLLILDIPTYDLFSRSLALKGKQPLEEVLSLTILVLIVLAIPIAPLYILYERLVRGESFVKLCRIATYMSDMRELGEKFLSNTCFRNFIFENHKNSPMEAKKRAWLRLKASREEFELWGKS
jgi:hypothetical protein